MPLETGTSISALNSSNPLAGDVVSQGDDHIRLIKNVLKTTFPGASAGGFAIPIIATEAQLNFVTGVTSNIQTQLNNKAAIGANTDITSLNSPNINSATAVTQAALDSTAKVATTAFVTTADNLKANLASPTFTGVPLAPTAAAGTNTTQIATTQFAVGKGGNETITGVKTFSAGAEPIAKNIAKAWAVFDGTVAGTNAPTAGFGVATITRNAVGDYTINFSPSLSTANYSITITGQGVDGVSNLVCQGSSLTAPTASAYRFRTVNPGVAFIDSARISFIVHGL